MKPSSHPTLVDLLQLRAKEQSTRISYTFIEGDSAESTLTYGQLDQQARSIAAHLQQHVKCGQRALLLYQPGFDYIAAFLGCLYAGVVAVPAYPPDPARLARTLPRLLAVINDCQAQAILTSSVIQALAGGFFGDNKQLNRIDWIATDLIDSNAAPEWKRPDLTRDSLAFLQYTSGSTQAPRGVMLDYNNLFANFDLVHRALGYGEHVHGVSWLPPYHDMGLIGGILQPLYNGFTMTLISPLDFLAKPLRWLKAISDKKASSSVGPNFAYDLCVRKVSPDERDSLDLSNWRYALNGAEPVRADTMQRFYNYFAPCGFKMEAFLPCYGLAEATLFVSGCPADSSPTVTSTNCVGAGSAMPGQSICIVDPETSSLVPEDVVGEIWINSPSVARGYWNNPNATSNTFGAYLASGEGPFLRTGDLGYLQNGELFVSGRMKDVIIIRGRNHYPHDIEICIENCHPLIRPGCAAAFALDDGNKEQLVVVQEIKSQHTPDDLLHVVQAIRKSVMEHHVLNIDTVLLIQAASIPKTSSGKVQRHLCKRGLTDNTLDIIYKSERQKSNDSSDSSTLLAIVSGELRRVLGLPESSALDIDASMVDFGLDSLMRVQLLEALEQRLGLRLKTSLFDEYPSMRALCTYLSAHDFSAQAGSANNVGISSTQEISEEYTRFDKLPGYLDLQEQLQNLQAAGLKNPFFTVHHGLVNDKTYVGSRELINFSNYNYLGLAGHPDISDAAISAIRQYGTTVSASRLVSGERPLHQQLERRLSQWIGTDDAIVYVSGHATNVSTIGHLFSQGDVVYHDSLSHNSIQQGIRLSRAEAIPFPHNDFKALNTIMGQSRARYRRALIVIEGIYSMDGDIADLPAYVELKKRHKAFLMVDEAHSIGILGKTGRGIGEHFDVNPRDVDLWMGTLSKSFASCGGYIAGSKALIDYLRYSSPGFVYSVGISPPNTAASLAAIDVLEREPQRVKQLQHNAELFLRLARSENLNTGMSSNTPIVPIIIGNTLDTLRLSERLFDDGINARPIVYPAVEENLSRLRFFITSTHSDKQIIKTVASLKKHMGVSHVS